MEDDKVRTMSSQQIEVTVTEISKTGNGAGAVNIGGETVLCEVPFTVPGDIVKASITHTKDGVALAKLASIVKASPLRTAPRCAHFSKCGGCRFQHVPYKGQLLHKEKVVRDSFAGLLRDNVAVHPIMGAKNPWNYRSKMDYTFAYDESGKSYLGHVEDGTKGNVLTINECHLCPQWFMDAVICVKQWWDASKIPPYDPINNKGVLRHLTLREGRRSGDRMVILSLANRNDFELNMRHIEKFVAQLNEYVKPHQEENKLSVFLRIHQISEGTTSSQYDMLLYGPGFIREGLKVHLDKDREPVNLMFEVGPAAFFQPNPQQTEVFIARALEMAGLTPESVVYDLYCGTGTFGLSASKFVKAVIGIELSPESASNARTNAKRNECDNVSIYSGAVRHVLNQLQENGAPRPDTVIINPPRSGLDPIAMEHLLDLKAPTILYISCYPQSQAKNIEALTGKGYRLTDIQPVDQFPQTNHIENIALLRRCD